MRRVDRLPMARRLPPTVNAFFGSVHQVLPWPTFGTNLPRNQSAGQPRVDRMKPGFPVVMSLQLDIGLMPGMVLRFAREQLTNFTLSTRRALRVRSHREH